MYSISLTNTEDLSFVTLSSLTASVLIQTLLIPDMNSSWMNLFAFSPQISLSKIPITFCLFSTQKPKGPSTEQGSLSLIFKTLYFGPLYCTSHPSPHHKLSTYLLGSQNYFPRKCMVAFFCWFVSPFKITLDFNERNDIQGKCSLKLLFCWSFDNLLEI